MVDPKIMCKKHLLGEHVELHMIVGALNKQKSMTGFVANNLLQPLAIKLRHDTLVKEMLDRGMNHKSPLAPYSISYLSVNEQMSVVNVVGATIDLIDRCPKCAARYKLLNGKVR